MTLDIVDNVEKLPKTPEEIFYEVKDAMDLLNRKE